MNTDTIVGSVLSAFSGALTATKGVALVVATGALSLYCDLVQPSLIKPIPPNTFYSRSLTGNVYFRSQNCGIVDCSKITIYMPLHNVDSDSFYVLTVPDPTGRDGYIVESNYARDKYRVFYKDETIHSADTGSFRPLSINLARDKTQYFLYDKSLKSYFAQIPESPLYTEAGQIEILAYIPELYLIMHQNGRFYYTQPMDVPVDIREISQIESEKYPKLTIAQP